MEVLENEQINRIRTGINGLDELVEGGFPQGSNIVVTGTPGTGKSIFGMNFIAEGCKNGEKCLYLVVEETPEDIIEQGKIFGWDFKKWQDEGILKIINPYFGGVADLLKRYNELRSFISENSFDRMVFDSISSITYSTVPASDIVTFTERGFQPSTFFELHRANIFALFKATKKNGTTTVSISQKVEGRPGDTVDNLSEFIGDGLILLNAVEVGDELKRTIKVKKLRKTGINGLTQTFNFTKNGIVIYHREV